jgi:hypothetical protein
MAATRPPDPSTGDTVARAKRTARADARRRHRAEQGLPPTTEAGEAPDATAAAAGRGTTPGQPERIGIGAAFKQSFRPLDVRGDLRALPQIATRTRALWVPLLVTIVAAVATAVTRGADILSLFAFQYFIVTPAIGGVFIAGFLAPRASWLLGVIVGFVSAICYTILGYGGMLPGGFQEAFAAQPTAAAGSSFILSTVMGAIFAAAAAWYRRFLQLSNPNRGRARAQQAGRRGNDGRSRSGDQKAGARR